MGIKRLRFKSLDDLLAHVPMVQEDKETTQIISRLVHVKAGHGLSRREFLDICRWKSPRSIRHCRRNSSELIERATRAAFQTRSEQQKLELLTGLHGVSVPTASAILTLTNPKRYGVIDIRVWQLLHRLRAVKENPRGQGFRSNHWLIYLNILRQHATRGKVNVRLVELTLFKFHQDHQSGTLYRRK
jgi:thermostable 8-oxoguanine DNA glycosylase